MGASAKSSTEGDGSEGGPSRRQFLAGAAGAMTIAATAGFSSTSSAEAGDFFERAGRLQNYDGKEYGDARIDLDGYHHLAKLEQEQLQQGNAISFDTRLDAVEDIGCDPTGSEPIEDKVMNAAADGVLIVFPPGKYLVTGEMTLQIDGTCGLVGEGYQNSTQPPVPGESTAVFKVRTEHPINLLNVYTPRAGKFGNFVIDQRDPLSHGGIQVISGGNVRVKDVRNIGPMTEFGNSRKADDNASFFSPQTRKDGALVVFERCVARGGSVPGTKNVGGNSGFAIFGRRGGSGNVVVKSCVIENMADNGIYGSRTTATVSVLGGLYRNNDVSQVRVNGDAKINGVDVIIDEANYTGVKTKANAHERGPGWPSTNGFKIETKSGISSNTGTPVVGCNMVGASAIAETNIGSLLRVWDSGGAVTADNCRITNNIPSTTSIGAEKPGSGNWAAAPRPWTVTVKNSVIEGSGAGQNGPSVNITDRPTSVVKSTCLKYSGASEGDISGASVASSVEFGTNCANAGLRNPEAVGKPGNMTVGNFTGNFSIGSFRSQGSQTSIIDKLVGMFTSIITSLAMIVLSIISIAIGLVLIVGIAMYKLMR